MVFIIILKIIKVSYFGLVIYKIIQNKNINRDKKNNYK